MLFIITFYVGDFSGNGRRYYAGLYEAENAEQVERELGAEPQRNAGWGYQYRDAAGDTLTAQGFRELKERKRANKSSPEWY